MESTVNSEELSQDSPELTGPRSARSRWVVGWGSLLFVILQSACTAVMAASGLRLLIGVGATVAASGLLPLERLHVNVLRIPMMLLAVGGALVNLYVIGQIRKLRARPASQWRVRPAAPRQLRSENLQIALAVITLVLAVAEESFHIYLHHVL